MLTVGSAVALYLAISCGIIFALLPNKNSVLGNWMVSSLIFFNNLNIFVCFNEINLGINIKFIQEDFRNKIEKYGKDIHPLVPATRWLALPIRTLKTAFDSRTWAQMWSVYSFLDPSYQSHKSFGFFIDVGNGLSTLPACVLLNYTFVKPEAVSPLFVGCVAIATYWQMFYGTVIYYFSYLYNRRYEGKGAIIFLLVFLINSAWMVFPAIAIYLAINILRDGSFDIIRERQ